MSDILKSSGSQIPPSGGGGAFPLGGGGAVRKAVKEDCSRMMELIQELAVYEKEPDAVTVTFDHFVESGFGEKPVWFAYVAEFEGNVEGFAQIGRASCRERVCLAV